MMLGYKFILSVNQWIKDNDIKNLSANLNKNNINYKHPKMLYTPLHLAVNCKNKEAVELIMKLKPDTAALTAVGHTALHLSISQKNTTITKKLLAHKVNAEIQTTGGFTPLHTAVGKDYYDGVEQLLNYGVNPNPQSKEGFTPLHWSLIKNNLEITLILLKHKAKMNIMTCEGKTGFDYMEPEFQEKLKNILLNDYGNQYQIYYENKIRLDMLFRSPQLRNLKDDLLSYFFQYLTPNNKQVIKKLRKLTTECLKEIKINPIFLLEIEKQKREETEKINIISVSNSNKKETENYVYSESERLVDTSEKEVEFKTNFQEELANTSQAESSILI